MLGVEAFLAEVMKDLDPGPTMQDLEGVGNGSLQVFFFLHFHSPFLCINYFLVESASHVGSFSSSKPDAGRRFVASVQRKASRPLGHRSKSIHCDGDVFTLHSVKNSESDVYRCVRSWWFPQQEMIIRARESK